MSEPTTDAELIAAAALLRADVAFVEGQNALRALVGASPAYSIDATWESYARVERLLKEREAARAASKEGSS